MEPVKPWFTGEFTQEQKENMGWPVEKSEKEYKVKDYMISNSNDDRKILNTTKEADMWNPNDLFRRPSGKQKPVVTKAQRAAKRKAQKAARKIQRKK